MKTAGSNLNESQFGGRDLELDETSRKIQQKKRKVLKPMINPGDRYMGQWYGGKRHGQVS